MRLIRIQEVSRKTGISRTTVWRLERAHQFPQRVRLSVNAVAWVEDEVERWVQDLAQKRPNLKENDDDNSK